MIMADEKKGHTPMRSWASPSYSPTTGRAASAFAPPGTSVTIEGCRIKPSAQIPMGVGALNKSGSGDPGRSKMNRE
jgi:hypothetical protein